MNNLIIIFSLCILVNNICQQNLKVNEKLTFCDAGNDISIAKNNTFNTPNSIIVTLDSSVSGINKDHSNTIFKNFPKESIRELTHIYNMDVVDYLNVDSYKQIFLVSRELKNDNELNNAVLDLRTKDGVFSVEYTYDFDQALGSPNDYFFTSGSLWNLGSDGVSATNAWNINTGSANVRVGIIDSGIMSHVDLNENLTTGYDFYNDNNITTDAVDDHGTHVAGIIGALGNNSIGVVGINWNVELVPLQTANNEGLHSEVDRIEAVNYATNLWGTENQISILNHSIGGFGLRTSLREAIRNFPGLFVWSTGNDNLDVDTYITSNGSFSLDNLISVGSVNRNNELSSFSNYSSTGINVDIYAPGEGIYSTISNNNYGIKSGTSMAAPHVAGTAALMLAEDPTLSGAELKEKILETSDLININIDSKNIEQTVKKINTYKAVLSAHSHAYGEPYIWANLMQHRTSCRCGDMILTGHFVSSDWNGIGTTKCLLCGGQASVGFVGPFSTNKVIDGYKYGVKIKKSFGKSSYLLENGLYVVGSDDYYDLLSENLKYPL